MAVLITQKGVLASGLAGVAISPNSVNAQELSAFSLAIAIDQGTSSSKVEQSLDGGVTWFGPVAAYWVAGVGATGLLVTTTISVNVTWIIPNPIGMYRVNKFADAPHVLTATYLAGPTIWNVA